VSAERAGRGGTSLASVSRAVSCEGYMFRHDNDEIEITERGVVWLITGG